MTTLILEVPTGPPVRADRFLADALPALSRRRVQALLETGDLRVDGRRLAKGATLAGGRRLTVEILADPARRPVPEPDLPIAILYEDASLVAVDKPTERPAQVLHAEDRGTVANFLAGRFPETVEAGVDPREAGLCHRLDTATSGVLLAARTRPAWEAVRAQFSRRTVVKTYLAVVVGELRRPVSLDLALGDAPRGSVRPDPDGRPATTRACPLASAPGTTLVEVEIETGVRHQIRAHLAASGHPVVGDERYGGRAGPRVLLHAAALRLRHPDTGDTLGLVSLLPEDFRRALGELGLRA